MVNGNRRRPFASPAAAILKVVSPPTPHNPQKPTLLAVGDSPAASQVATAQEWQVQPCPEPYDAIDRLRTSSSDVAAVLVSLVALEEGEAAVVRALKRVRPDVPVFLADADHRPALLAEAALLGGDGVVATGGRLHRFGTTLTPPPVAPPPQPVETVADVRHEPVLTNEELVALLGT